MSVVGSRFQNASGISISVQRRRLLGQPALAEPTAWRTFLTWYTDVMPALTTLNHNDRRQSSLLRVISDPHAYTGATYKRLSFVADVITTQNLSVLDGILVSYV
jgi:hypothetical protein